MELTNAVGSDIALQKDSVSIEHALIVSVLPSKNSRVAALS